MPTAWSIAVVLRLPARAEVQCGQPDGDRPELGDVASASGGELVHDGRGRQRVLVRVAALRADPALVGLERRAVGDRLVQPCSPLLSVDAEIGEREQMRARRRARARGSRAAPRRVRVAIASRISSALPTARPSGWSMSVSRQTTSRPARCAEVEHRLGERARVLDRLHEGAVADLHVEHDRVRAAGDLLRHDARRDQRVVVDGRGHVAQRVELLVGRHEVGARADDRHPRLAHLRDELVGRELDPEARDRLELVERAACVAEPAAAHLRERDAARGDDRADRDRRLVADAAGRVLVDDLAAERGAQVDGLAAWRSSRRSARTSPAASARGSRRPCRTRPAGSRALVRGRSRA